MQEDPGPAHNIKDTQGPPTSCKQWVCTLRPVFWETGDRKPSAWIFPNPSGYQSKQDRTHTLLQGIPPLGKLPIWTQANCPFATQARGRYNQASTRSEWYRVILNKRGALRPHSPTQQQQKRRHYQQNQRKTCRPNSFDRLLTWRRNNLMQ